MQGTNFSQRATIPSLHIQPSILEAYEWGQTQRIHQYPDFYSGRQLAETNVENDEAMSDVTMEKNCWESFVEGFKAFFAAIFACICCCCYPKEQSEIESAIEFLKDRTHTMSEVTNRLYDLFWYINNNIDDLTDEEVRQANDIIITTLNDRCQNFENQDIQEIYNKQQEIGRTLDINGEPYHRPMRAKELKILPSDMSVHDLVTELIFTEFSVRRWDPTRQSVANYIEDNPKKAPVQEAISYVLNSYRAHNYSHYNDIRRILRDDIHLYDNSYQEDLANMQKANEIL
ncbi:MAG: hypothetical protein FJZ56_06990 [Chlamydiae bacterium]|nr:hypothetical protein [Chlamydiota bacterium]